MSGPPFTISWSDEWDEDTFSRRIVFIPSREPTEEEQEAIQRTADELQKRLLRWPTTWTEVPR